MKRRKQNKLCTYLIMFEELLHDRIIEPTVTQIIFKRRADNKMFYGSQKNFSQQNLQLEKKGKRVKCSSQKV